jgi:hypothetical protein
MRRLLLTAFVRYLFPMEHKQPWYRTWDRAHLTAHERDELRKRRR